MENLFKAGPPVSGSDFYGRRELISNLVRYVGGHSSLLIGQRRIGKSSLLREVARLLKSSPESLPRRPVVLRCDAQSVSGEADGFEQLLVGPLEQLAQWTEESGSDFKIPSKYRMRALTYRAAEDIFSNAGEHGLQLLLEIDEVDALTEAGRQKLRALVMQTGISVLAVCSKSPEMLGIMGGGSAWFNFFAMNYVRLFSDAEAREMLLAISGRSGRPFSEKECSVLIDVMGRFPFFLQIGGLECFRSDAFLASTDPCGNAFRSALTDTNIQLQPHFHGMLNRLDERELEILIEIAKGKDVPESAAVSELEKMSLVTRLDAKRLKPFSSSFSLFVLGAAKQGAGRTTGNDTDHRKWWEAASDVAAKAIGTAIEKAIELAMKG